MAASCTMPVVSPPAVSWRVAAATKSEESHLAGLVAFEGERDEAV